MLEFELDYTFWSLPINLASVFAGLTEISFSYLLSYCSRRI